jgi:ferric-chelate reductase
MGMLLVLSSVWLRRRFYDLFLLIHIAFSILTIVSLFYHTSVFVDRQYDGYLWPVVAIWVFDRFLRLVRLTYCNLRVASGGKFISTTKATATYSEAANVVKLVVSPAHSLLRPRPGQYYFVYRPLRWKGWESHPFTVGSWRDESDYVRNDVYSSSASSSGDARPRSINDDKEKEGSVVNASHDSSRSNSVSKPLAASGQELIFWLRPRDGFTRELRDHCRKFDNFTSTSSILIEGPYGHHAKLHNYETVLLIAGGTGMSGIVCYIQEHIRRVKAGKPVRTQNIQVIFSCKQEAFIREVCAAELREAVSRDDIDFQFFSTGTQMSISSAAGSKTEAPNRGVNVEVVVSHGRPDLGAAVSSAAQAIAEGGARAGRLAVLVCGPASMADQARKSVRRAMKEGRRNIEYIEETFGW